MSLRSPSCPVPRRPRGLRAEPGAHRSTAAREIEDGDAIVVSNPHGRFAARAKVTQRIPAGAVWMRDGWPGFNALTDGAAVLPSAALTAFPFSVGQSGFGARVDVRRMETPAPD